MLAYVQRKETYLRTEQTPFLLHSYLVFLFHSKYECIFFSLVLTFRYFSHPFAQFCHCPPYITLSFAASVVDMESIEQYELTAPELEHEKMIIPFMHRWWPMVCVKIAHRDRAHIPIRVLVHLANGFALMLENIGERKWDWMGYGNIAAEQMGTSHQIGKKKLDRMCSVCRNKWKQQQIMKDSSE